MALTLQITNSKIMFIYNTQHITVKLKKLKEKQTHQILINKRKSSWETITKKPTLKTVLRKPQGKTLKATTHFINTD